MSKELRQLFKNNSDCYADTHYYSNDTIPPTKVEGEVIQAMTEDKFIELFESKLKEAEENKANFIRLHIADLSNLVSKSAARDNRLTMLANELKKTTRQ